MKPKTESKNRTWMPFKNLAGVQSVVLWPCLAALAMVLTVPARAQTFTDADWVSLGSGMNNTVGALAVIGTNLYAAGAFTMAGGVMANHIAKWDGSAWSALGPWSNAGVGPLAVSGTNLYAVGGYTTTNGGWGYNIAKWDGSAWSAFGSGIGGAAPGSAYALVDALAVSGTTLYVGGSFTNAGGVPVNNIAKWDGSNWSALGSGMGNYDDNYTEVYALAVMGTNLYAGGYFSWPGNNIATWDGSSWSALGSGMGGGYVHALAVSGTNLYAGMYCTSQSGLATIAKWDGSGWAVVGAMGPPYSVSLTFPYVSALAVSGTNLYAGGMFDGEYGGPVLPGIAQWDGSTWSALGSGIGEVKALVADGAGHLFVGGYWSGNKVSPNIAQANVSGALGHFWDLAYLPATGFTFTFSGASAGQPYRIQTTASLASGSWTDFTNFTYTGPTVIRDTAGVGTTNRFYRAVSP